MHVCTNAINRLIAGSILYKVYVRIGGKRMRQAMYTNIENNTYVTVGYRKEKSVLERGGKKRKVLVVLGSH